MFTAVRLMVITFALNVIAMPSTVCSQDMGSADTVRISDAVGDVEGDYSYPFPVSISIYNDYDLKSMVIPLIIDGYSGWARFDSVSYTGGRLDDPNILDNREVYSFGTDSITVDSLVLKFELGSGVALPAGDGKICDLWLRPIYGGEMSIDSLSVSPYGNLQLITTVDDQYTPQFQAGLVTIECDYTVGDVRGDGGVNVSDMLGLYKGYLGCLDEDWGDPWRADVNCDRRIDLRDAINLLDFIFFDSTDIICDCGTYTPSIYNDPGLPDTVWIGSDTLYVGRPDTIDVGIVNDEILRGFAFALEWDGSAVLDYYGHYSAAERLEDWYVILAHYMCDAADQVNPDSMFVATWDFGMDSGYIAPGSEAVIRIAVTPQTQGTISFRLISYPTWYDYMLTRSCETMLVTQDKEAILPILRGGNIVVLPKPYICGDANSDDNLNITDVVWIINYVFRDGDPPIPMEAGDVNCDVDVNVSDAVWFLNYIFIGGNEPCDTDGDGLPDC